jgi:hypothetical protein
MNKIAFKILPSPETNDHEIRILIDNEDFLGDDYLGLDPPSFFSQDTFDTNGELMIGRCTCGVEGCSDYPMTITVNEKTITWTDNNGLNLEFDKTEYLSSFATTKADYSWEDIKRKVERLTTDILKHSKTTDGFKFDWASARIKENQITLSYSKNGEQKLFDIDWNGQSEAYIKQDAEKFLEKISYSK